MDKRSVRPWGVPAFVAIVCAAILGWLAWGYGQPSGLKAQPRGPLGTADKGLSWMPEEVADSLVYTKPWRAGERVDTGELRRIGPDRCFAIEPVTDSLLQTMRGKSWPEDCPIDPTTLRYLRVLHWNCDDLPQMGELIVHKQIATKVIEAFEELYDAHYRIERMVLVDHYGGSDEQSMTDNNSSAFNFRYMTGSTTKISKHGLGLAIDINPLYNPYVKRRSDGSLYVEPEAGRPFASDRSRPCKVSLIGPDDPAYHAFTQRGFEWGGAWKSCQDYQHFEIGLAD